MAFCNNCGAQIPEDKKFCASCGQPVAEASAPGQQAPPQYQQQMQYQQPPAYQQPDQQAGGEFDAEDIEKNKTMAGLSYFIFFLPLIVCPQSRYARFHANQGLVLFLFSLAASLVLTIIPIIGWILLFILPILVIVLAIMGLLNGLNGRAKELPVIGKLKIIK